MRKLLIATASKDYAGLLTEALAGSFDLYFAHNGKVALDFLDSLRPDALIVDFGLPYIGGLSVLQSSSHRPSAILALSTHLSEEIIRISESSGVDCIVLLPNSIRAIANELFNLVEQITKIPSPDA